MKAEGESDVNIPFKNRTNSTQFLFYFMEKSQNTNTFGRKKAKVCTFVFGKFQNLNRLCNERLKLKVEEIFPILTAMSTR